MATLTVATLRQRVAAVVEALASPAAWRESPWAYDAFPLDTQQAGHLAFAVGVTRTTYDGAQESYRSSRGAAGAAVTSRVSIRWLFRLREDNAVADYDSALAAEAVLLTALPATSLADLHLSLDEATRRVVSDGTFVLGEVTLTAKHRLAIQ